MFSVMNTPGNKPDLWTARSLFTVGKRPEQNNHKLPVTLSVLNQGWRKVHLYVMLLMFHDILVNCIYDIP